RLPQDGPARLRHDHHHLRPGAALRRAEKPEALPVRLPQPRHFLRALDQHDPRRPGGRLPAEADDGRRPVHPARGHLLADHGPLRIPDGLTIPARAPGGVPMTRSGILTLMTDFGRDGPYVAAMKGVILGLAPDAKMIDVSHGIA